MKPAPSAGPVPPFATLSHAHREVLRGPLIGFAFAIVCIAVVILTLIGPAVVEGGLGLLPRLALVGSCAMLCWPLWHGLNAAVLYLMRSQPPLWIAVASGVATIFMTIPCVAVAYTAYGLLFPLEIVDGLLPKICLSALVMLLTCSFLIHYVACHLVLLRLAVGRDDDEAGSELPAHRESQTASPSVPSEPFFDRLPASVGRDVIYLKVTGHYVDVVTTQGSCLVLMRLTDAVASLADRGMQVHRSYWVASQHVEGLVRRDDRTVVCVTGGHEIPVSRTYVASVRAHLRRSGEA